MKVNEIFEKFEEAEAYVFMGWDGSQVFSCYGVKNRAQIFGILTGFLASFFDAEKMPDDEIRETMAKLGEEVFKVKSAAYDNHGKDVH